MDLIFDLSEMIQTLEDTLSHEEIEIFLSTDLTETEIEAFLFEWGIT